MSVTFPTSPTASAADLPPIDSSSTSPAPKVAITAKTALTLWKYLRTTGA